MLNPVANVVNLNVVSYVNIGPGAVLPFVDTLIIPVPHRDGTVTCNWVALAFMTVVVLPLNETLFCDADDPKPEPVTVTVSPTGPWVGLMAVTAKVGVVELELLLQLKVMPNDRHKKRNVNEI